jgi:hypothetical protein
MCGDAAAYRAETRSRPRRLQLLAARLVLAVQVLAIRRSGFRASLDVGDGILGAAALVGTVRPEASTCVVEAALAVAACQFRASPVRPWRSDRIRCVKATAPHIFHPSIVLVLLLFQRLYQRLPQCLDRYHVAGKSPAFVFPRTHAVGWQRGDVATVGEADFVAGDWFAAMHGNAKGRCIRGYVNRYRFWSTAQTKTIPH